MDIKIASSQKLTTVEEEHIKRGIEQALAIAKTRGASQAEVDANTDVGFTVNVRMGDVETIEFHRDKGIAVTVYYGKRKGSASSSDIRIESIEEAVNAACDIAQLTEDDECNGLADKELMAFNYPDLDLYHPWALTPEEAIKLALECEAIGRDYDKRIVNSEGASITTVEHLHIYANTHGFIGQTKSSSHNMSCQLVAQGASGMQRDYYYTVAHDKNDLENLRIVATKAAERSVARLNARHLTTRKAPIIFRADVARGLCGHFINAISGGNLYRRASFLTDMLEQQIFPEFISIHQRPYLPKGIGSAAFDHDGVATKDLDYIQKGILKNYVLSNYSARKLGMQTTGNSGGVHNLVMDDLQHDFDLTNLFKQMDCGLFVTELMGQGVNIVTGDYSRGAAGFWIENGEIQYPVEGITIAGNLRQMFLNLAAVGNDIDRRGNVQTGSILIEQMTIAGS